MDKTSVAFLLALFASFSLSSCVTFTPPNHKHAGTCNTLRSDLIFNGSTSNVREAEIENSQQPLEQRNYDRDDCDQG
jgi:hypothetical protein